MSTTTSPPRIAAGMIGFGMIFDDTYRPFFEAAHRTGLYASETGPVQVTLAAAASRTGTRAERYLRDAAGRVAPFRNFAGPTATPGPPRAGARLSGPPRARPRPNPSPFRGGWRPAPPRPTTATSTPPRPPSPPASTS